MCLPVGPPYRRFADWQILGILSDLPAVLVQAAVFMPFAETPSLFIPVSLKYGNIHYAYDHYLNSLNVIYN